MNSSMRIALIGSQSCGRTTLLRALAGSDSVDPGKPVTISVPDTRLDFLASQWNPEKVIHAVVTFTDTPSPAYSPLHLNSLRSTGAIALVLDNYAMGEPDKAFLDSESALLLSDLEIVENRLARLLKEGRIRSNEHVLLERIADHISDERPLRCMTLSDSNLSTLSPYGLLSLKPLLVISNRSSRPVSDESGLKNLVRANDARFLSVDSLFELELADIPEAEREAFLESMGYDGSVVSRILRESYSVLDMITFFTLGDDEVRAWPVRKGTTALEAAGVIHSDLARGFIRAQVIPFESYEKCPDLTELRSRGELGIEGKDYVVNDGDIVRIRFSV